MPRRMRVRRGPVPSFDAALANSHKKEEPEKTKSSRKKKSLTYRAGNERAKNEEAKLVFGKFRDGSWEAKQDKYDDWGALAETCEDYSSLLTNWEVNFIDSILHQIDRRAPLTDKQETQLERIWGKVSGEKI